ncbi:MAG: UDP-N-acetylmuramoyl-L-alanyl-D-glutamate--2,6-diaminopimelate ligase [Candidatus Omnitrophica bacterium]|nr:UDP-N-acetylmuramoyl-L-alanyl-D-glutamate--2,6-diaminopimelate ligase [Candidatus Omnitrophota bacterium]
MKIKELVKTLGKSTARGIPDFEVMGVTCDSRSVDKGFVFVAIKGNRQDGNKFIAEAIARGAKAVVVHSPHVRPFRDHKGASFIGVSDTRLALGLLAAKFYGYPSQKVKVVGITGTNGKTTLTYILEAIIKECGGQPAVIGTINYRFGGESAVSKNTTPGPVELQAMLADMSNRGADYLAMEVSSHALDQARTEGITFHSAIFTNLTQDHLDYHKTLANYFKSKARLFEGLRADAFAVTNNDDRYGRKISSLTAAEVVTYAIDSPADVRASGINYDIAHTEFSISVLGESIRVKTNLIGRHNVLNVLAAFAWALRSGFGIRDIQRAIEKFSAVPGRLEKVNIPRDFEVFVDYAHTEDALDNVIRTLRPLSKNRLIVVFGCGGERDKAKRPKMGRVVTQLSDYAIITSDNPRSEEPEEIIADIRRGIKKSNYCVIPERELAIRESLSLAKPGDIILVAGKGHENYQVIKEQTIAFDDREVIRKCIRQLNS